jgi:hypothetical protein
MIRKRLFSAALSAAIALTLGAGQASAHKPRRCPDGTVVSDSRRCPPKAMTARAGVQHGKPPAGLGRTIYNPNVKSPLPPTRPK